MKYRFSLLLFALGLWLNAQQVKILNEEKSDVSFRGLTVLDNGVFWVTGTKGTVGMSYNSGKTIKWVNPKGYENRDFRDIHCWDYKTAIIMAVGSPGIILKTKDGGNNWYEVYKDESADVFFNAMDFYERNENIGVLVGDPKGSYPYVLVTENRGEKWERISSVEKYPSLAGGEAFFAASGSNIKLINDSISMTVSGGMTSNFVLNTKPLFKQTLANDASSETSGANGLDYSSFENYGLIVGGDFVNPESSENNLFIFDYDKSKNPVFSKPQTPPNGYKSGVTIVGNSMAVACGTSGIDVSNDKGKNWKFISPESFHVCQRAKNGNKVYFAGPNGKIGILVE